MKNNLFIVYCIDTEGPIHESLSATFERLYDLYGIDIEPTRENLLKIQNQELDFNGIEGAVATTFSKQLLCYNDTWDKIDLMLDKVMTREFRNKYKDSNGKGIVYNWHCMDNVGFLTNERRRDLGFGNVFKHYKNKIFEHGGLDRIHWHFHPLSFNKEAHICSTSYVNSYDTLYQILCRRLIDFDWFPVVNRAGFHSIRQDSSFFLEQWIPFDYSNQATHEETGEYFDHHRYGDWRRAPKEWVPYHPSYQDYQTPGQMNRYTTKCLNIGTRLKLLDEFEIEMAFKDAIKKGSAILSFTNHDFRDIAVDIDNVYSKIMQMSGRYPQVSIINADAATAMQSLLYSAIEVKENAIKLTSKTIVENNSAKVVVNCENGEVFGSQPFLSIKTKDGRYHHDNFNETVLGKTWEYIFDRATMELSSIEKIGVAANDKYGNQSIASINVS